MALCQPTVVGPLSELSHSVRVQGQLPGAKVTVRAIGPHPRTLAKGVAGTSDERLALLVGQHLTAGDIVVAIQEIGGEQSDPQAGNLGTAIQPKPHNAGQIGGIGLETHLWQCGQYVWVSGAIPGAEVRVADTNPLGGGIANEGIARFELTAPLQAGVPTRVFQTVPGLGDGPALTGHPEPIPPQLKRILPPPVMREPLRGCDPSVHVSHVFDGAQVAIRNQTVATTTAGFDRSALNFILPSPLTEGDELLVEQHFQGECQGLVGTWSAPPVRVGPAKPVKPPVVQAPLCVGSTRIGLTNLRPGALVHISANGTVYDAAVPRDSTAHTFSVPALTGGSVSATQEICNVSSGPSKAVPVDPHAQHVDPPTVVRPLFDCARCVTVENLHPGATVQVWARTQTGEGPISDLVTIFAAQGVIDVNPYLDTGDHVYVMQWACSDTGVKSRSEKVIDRPGLMPPTVLDPIYAGDTQVEVEDALAGTLIEVYVTEPQGGWIYAGRALANNLSPITSVPLGVGVTPRNTVFARQFMCTAGSDNHQGVPVRPAATFGPRPFYVMAHNPNTIKDVRDALAKGANCVEPDVNVYDDTTDQLCISEAGLTGNASGDSDSPSLVDFLNGLRQAADDFPHLALVVFDTKSPAVSASNGLAMLTAIREHLTKDTNLNVIISVADLSQTAMFDSIKNRLRPREGVMIDSENDPIAVSNYFYGARVVNECYANGITHETILGPNVRPSMERACEFRAARYRTRFIYVWTVNDDDHMREYIRIGVDSVDTDDVDVLSRIVKEPEFAPLIRLAVRDDDPFGPPNFTYGLTIHTSDRWMAGTDANVTLTLTGTSGSASKTVNTQLPYRMESDDWNYVTVPSDDLGALQSITVQRDNQGNGPDWHLDQITVESQRFGTTKHAHFDCWIDSMAPFTRPLV
jgi:glycerophosphoryl diester phosphodiesterase